MPLTYSFGSAYHQILSVLIPLAWIAVPIFLAIMFWNLRLLSVRVRFFNNIEWVLLEVRVGEQSVRTPKAMEHVFASLFGIYSFGISSMSKYLKGTIDLWFSFEILGKEDGIRFYVRTPSKYRNLVESALYSQYPDIEIEEAEDYVYEFGRVIPNETYDLWGTGYKLTKDSVYPLRTYKEFEPTREKEEYIVDPLAMLFEALSKLKNDETVFFQMMISPTGAATGFDIKKKAEKEIATIIEEKGMKHKNKEGDEEKASSMTALTPGMRDVVKAIEDKASQLLFETTMRFVYIDRKDSFNRLNISSVMGSFQQFNSQSLNSIRSDGSSTSFGGIKAMLFPWYKNAKLSSKKRRLFEYYATRRFGMSNHFREEKLPVLSVEELATLFHFPRSFMKAPKLRGVYSRKGGPPSDLPVA